MAARWLLDDGPFEVLARHIDRVRLEHWPTGAFLVSEETAKAAASDPKRRALIEQGQQAQAGAAFDTPLVSIFSILADAEAAGVIFGHLRRNEKSEANLAEHQCIAYGLTAEPDSVFVTLDKRAAFLALYELGPGRVVHPIDLWAYLEQIELIDSLGFARLVEYTTRVDQSLSRLPWRFQRQLNRNRRRVDDE